MTDEEQFFACIGIVVLWVAAWLFFFWLGSLAGGFLFSLL